MFTSPPLPSGNDQPSDELCVQGAPFTPASCPGVRPRHPCRPCSLLLLFLASSNCPRCQKSRIRHQRTSPFQTSGLREGGQDVQKGWFIVQRRWWRWWLHWWQCCIWRRYWFIFFDTCIIFASLPSHSATSLSAVLLYVQCVCFPAGFWSLCVLVCFLFFCFFPGFCNFLENQGCDITSDIARLTCRSGCHDTYIKYNKRLMLPPSGRSETSSPYTVCFISNNKADLGPVSRSAFTSFPLLLLLRHIYFTPEDLIG